MSYWSALDNLYKREIFITWPQSVFSNCDCIEGPPQGLVKNTDCKSPPQMY